MIKMYEDPQDMFREMDELFAHLVTRMTREFATGEPQGFGYSMIIRRGGESSALPSLPIDQVRSIQEPVVEIHRIGDEVKVITGLPGATMDAVRLGFQGSSLTIDAAAGSLHYHAKADLPAADPGSMQTSFKNGVLEVTLRSLPETSQEEGS
jgi:HSP20 family molecular chaperone IbpA